MAGNDDTEDDEPGYFGRRISFDSLTPSQRVERKRKWTEEMRPLYEKALLEPIFDPAAQIRQKKSGYENVTACISKPLMDALKEEFVRQGENRQFSLLVEKLLARWLYDQGDQDGLPFVGRKSFISKFCPDDESQNSEGI